jgi:hypothetical protein
MNFLKLLPVILSFLLLGAHFYRAGQLALVMVAILLMMLLAFRKTWLPRLIQLALLLGALEWLRTAYMFMQIRIHYDLPWVRMAIILGTVSLLTALSGLVFRSKSLRKRYSYLKGVTH